MKDNSILHRDRREFVSTVCGGLAASLLWPRAFAKTHNSHLVFCCSAENDLFRAVTQAGVHAERYDTPGEAVAHAPRGSGVLILAESYPDKPTNVSREDLENIGKKHLHAYIEYSSGVLTSGAKPETAGLKRAVVSSSFFGASLPPLSIVSPHNCQYFPADTLRPGMKSHLVLAKVAGFDTAVYGLPNNGVEPLLVADETGSLLIATSKLSCFISARYAPHWAWKSIWNSILEWLSAGEKQFNLQPVAVVRPSWTATETLPDDAQHQALSRGVQWYYDARVLVHPSWADKLEEASKYPNRTSVAPLQQMASGDGSLGVLEGFSSEIEFDGSQPIRWWIRSDCTGETAMTMALAHAVKGSGDDSRVALNLMNYYMHSKMATAHTDPSKESYGLLGWNHVPDYVPGENGYDVFYGDDNARCLLGILTASALLGETRWQERCWLAVLANFRLVGTKGFQEWRYDEAPLQKNGWRYYFEKPTVLHDMNYEAYPWALFLWAYSATGYEPFLERTYQGIRLTMEAYPNGWRSSNSITVAQARLLLPLAWLVRIKPTEETRSWLNRIATDLLARQDSSGAIAEWLDEHGIQGPPKSNDQYGGGEGCLIQKNGDPATDLIYTVNFAFLGLHEAHWATGDAHFKEASDRLADFLIRAQARSEVHPEFNGVWFRAFDFKIWDYWASNSDSGWGAWCVESGWIQSWIPTVLALRILKRSLWDITATAPSFPGFEQLRKSMLPD